MSSNSGKAHWSIGNIEKYYISIRRTYNIVHIKSRDIIVKNAILQMVLKTVNNIVGLDGLLPHLLIFGSYLEIVTDLPHSPL